MISIEKISYNISEKISSKLSLDQDRQEVIKYGTFSLIQMLWSIILVVIFGALFKVMIEALIISFVIGILRKYSGGVHASTPAGCNIIGTLICIVQAVTFCYIYSWFSAEGIVAISFVIFIWAYYMVFKLAPVDNHSKPIKKEAKRRRLRKASILMLSVYFVFNAVNIAMYLSQAENKFLIYSLCICGGVAWQVFTLTKTGHFVINKLDFFLNQIFRIGKE